MEKTLGTRIAEFRKNCGLTQEEVAEKLGVSPQAVSKWENDLSCPDIMSLPVLAGVFGTTVDILLSGEKTPEVQYVPVEQRRDLDELMLRIKVNGGDGERVRINVPISLVRVMMESGASPNTVIGGTAAQSLDFAQILRLVESGAIGKLMDIQVDDGTVVEIVVE